jgi:hypothetical protein
MKYNRITNAEDNFRQPVFWQTPVHVVRSPFSLSVIRDLHFNFVHLKTVTQAEQEGKLFGRLASVLWVLCTCQCACLVALAIRDFAYCPPSYYSVSAYASSFSNFVFHFSQSFISFVCRSINFWVWS